MRISGFLSIQLILFFITQSAGQGVEKLYGVTNGPFDGQPNGYGNVFSFDPSLGTVTSIHAFNGVDGSALTAGLTFLSDGYFYGTAQYGGLNSQGTIFKIKPDGTGFQKMHDFNGSGGSVPAGGLVEYCAGVLYGSTMRGGTNDSGIFYKINSDGSGFQKLIDFDQIKSGYSPRAKPIFVDSAFFLTNLEGGINNWGTILKILPDGTFSKSFDFDGASSGSFPNSALILGSNNKLYGTASSGGINNNGTLFSLNIDGTGFVKLLDFSNSTGTAPLATLVEVSGVLFGTTAASPWGTLFKVNLDGSNFTVLHNFGVTIGDGAGPDGGLVLSNGELYGITLLGGVNQIGTIYSVMPDGSSYKKIYDFTAPLSGNPRYSLVPAKNTFSSQNAFPFFSLGADEFLCVKPNVKLQPLSPSGYTFTWQDNSNDSFFEVTDFGTYWVKIENSCDVASDTIKFIKLDSVPHFSLGKDEILCSKPNLKLQPLANQSGYVFTWQDNSHNSFFDVTDLGTYSVKIENSCGAVSDTVRFIKPVTSSNFIPNVITPNGDGLNETFVLDQSLLGSHFTVLNRWGGQVYENNDYQNTWDGAGLTAGVYFYFVRDKCNNEFKGPVTILR